MIASLNAVMDAIGVRLATIAGLRVFDFPAESVSVPAAIVAYADIVYDSTYARGMDQAVFPVHVLVSTTSDRMARDALEAYRAPTGAKSVKAAVDGSLGGVVSDARVARSTVETIEVNGVAYIGATFDVEVFA